MPEGMKTDAELIKESRRDPDAFGELYRRHAVAVHRWFCARTDERNAEDLTAETFAQAVLSLKRFRDEAGGSAAPWLFGIARNLLRHHLERRRVETAARRRLGMPIRADEPDFDAVEDRSTTENLKRELDEALALLPASQRRALQLRVVEELPYADVAATLGCSELAARLRVMRARTSLTRLLKGAVP
jgi:RNA polymerase sigma factor (sigma-70 family)